MISRVAAPGYIVALNAVALGIAPAVALGLVAAKTGAFPAPPGWAGGIFLSWAFTINIWVGLGSLFRQRFTPLAGGGFLFFNFLLPFGLGIATGNSPVTILSPLVTYHFLALGLASGVLMLLGPFIRRVDAGNRLLGKYELKKMPGRKDLAGVLVWLVLGCGVFGYTLVLPSIWIETVLNPGFQWIDAESIWGAIRSNARGIIRYPGIAVDSLVIFNLLFRESIFDE